MNNCRKEKHWIKYPKKRDTYEWKLMSVDWLNECRLDYVETYFRLLENFEAGLKNEHIMLSTFGRKPIRLIKEYIQVWFNDCVGTYSEIEFNK